MTALKAGEIDRLMNRPEFTVPVILVYGPDRGLVSERAMILAKASSVPLDDPFSAIRLDPDALSADPDRLANEAYTVSMFGGDRLIWLRGAGNDAKLIGQLESLLSDPPQGTRILIEAGDLNKKSKLRDLAERAKNALAIPCYQDNDRAVQGVIDDVLGSSGLQLSLDARRFLSTRLGGDRQASRGEMEKLVLYAGENKKVELADVQAILGDASALDMDAITDGVLTGNIAGFDTAFSKFISAGGACQQVLAATIRQFQMLDRLYSDMEASGKNPASAVASAKPPIFFARKQAFETALGKWTGRAIRAALERLQSATLESRKARSLEVDVTRTALLALAVQSARRR